MASSIQTVFVFSWTISPQYIAGFFDGEGCITMRRANKYRIGNHQYLPTYALVVGFTNCNLEILKELQIILGGKIYPKYRRTPNASPAYELNLLRKGDVQSFLENVGPYVRIKAPQIALARDFLTLPKIPMLHVGRGKTWPLFRGCPQASAVKEGYKTQLTKLNKRGLNACEKRGAKKVI